jgi:signal transduction histidine kinase
MFGYATLGLAGEARHRPSYGVCGFDGIDFRAVEWILRLSRFSRVVDAAGSGGGYVPAMRRRDLGSRLRWSACADLALALVCFVLGLVEVATLDGEVPVLVLCAGLMTLPVAWRLRAPLAATVVVAVSWVILHRWGGVGGEPFFELAVLPVIYSLGAHPNLKRATGGFAVLLAAVAVTDLPDLGFFGMQFAVLWLTGRGVRAYRAQSEQLRALAHRLEGERPASDRLAVAQERQRIAGELHDTIAHAVSIMVVQAGGAGQMLSHQPDRARVALIAVQDNGRDAIAQLQRVLRLLRSTPDRRGPEADLPLPAPAGGWWNRRLIRSTWVDVLLAVFVVLFSDSSMTHIDSLGRTPVPIVVSAAVAFVAIMARRRMPLVALLIAATATVAELLLFGDATGFASIAATMLVMYSVGAHTATRRSVPAAVTALVALVVLVLFTVGPDSAAVSAVWLGMPWFAGRHVRIYRRRAERLRALTSRLTHERDARARLAVLDERARVARELHDSLAHSINVMVLQAGAAEQVLIPSPDRARDAIRVVESQGRQAHNDLSHLLGLLDGVCVSQRTPQPSLTRLETLLDQVRQTGLPITLRVAGHPARLPADLDTSAYRIVQEALTNTLKHAGPVPTTVTLDYLPDALGIEIRNPGISRPSRPDGRAGHGLLGMRERAMLYGGTLETGPCPDGGFIVRAHLPLDAAVA